MTNEEYMSEAVKLARNGAGWVSPNPMVGAVIVKRGEIIGSGWHEVWGETHAERNALKSCKIPPKDATLYVTLEPCCHYGKTPPCTDAILEAGISKVVIGSRDPNPLVNGVGVKLLRENGVEVVQDVLRDECDNLNCVFFHYITQNTPYVIMKYAMTMDGKIATRTRASKWITGEASREHAHRSRHEYSAIMVGINTVITDNPMLNCRMEGGKNPVRIICDSCLRMPLDSQIVKTSRNISTIILTADTNEHRRNKLEAAGCRIIYMPNGQGKVDLRGCLEALHEDGIDSIYLEGGATLNYSMLKEGLVNRVHAYISPKLLGGREAPSPVGGEGIEAPDEAILLSRPTITYFDDDILLDCELR